LKIQHILASRIQSGNLVFLNEPNDERSENVTESDDEKTGQCAQVKKNHPLPVGRFIAGGQGGGTDCCEFSMK
jgi:hypothetical protein